ncbi:exopolysaccharide biosynthesis protein [Paracoccus stylophorae]|uniref:Exopolysaccharide biosynthesis protein n=1 Tax=Paracoccus stylophorae TaxID=659350 RepID=A0ABY7SWS7_9RHOB|nr:exopolysaccharide biosynthesis protein [Paracoccus stylophorae]WCR11290.1 exopolysaccharide biosynthesis protein [Paracoccus stylophorae]
MPEDFSIVSLIDRAVTASDDRTTSVAQILQALGRNSFAPNLLLPAVAVLSPLSGVPLVSTFCGCVIALVSAQMLVGRDHIWLPQVLMRRKIATARLRQVGETMKTPAGWLDRITRPRLRFLSQMPFAVVPRMICLVGGMVMPFLELVPFTSSIIGAVVTLLGFGMLARDGLFTLLGLLAVAGLAGGLIWLLG